MKILPDISKWNTSNFININALFRGCTSLISLPDISNWNLDKCINMIYLFCDCESLISLPDISKWNLNPNAAMNDMFSG